MKKVLALLLIYASLFSVAHPLLPGLISSAQAAYNPVDYFNKSELFGPCSDGNVTISTTVAATRTMYFQNLTITGTGDYSGAGFKIFVCNKLTIQSGGVFEDNGSNGQNGTAIGGGGGAPSGGSRIDLGNGTTPGIAGGAGGTTTGTQATLSTAGSGIGGAGGASVAGGTGSSGAGGAARPGGVLTSRSLNYMTTSGLVGAALMNGGTCGGAGGGGGGDSSNSGGGGGGSGLGGRVVFIFAKYVDNSGTISADGGNGGNGGTPTTGNTGGGSAGGGGGGGFIELITYQFTGAGMGTVVANGGNPGTPGTGHGTGTTPSASSSGNAGGLTIYEIFTNTWTVQQGS